MNEEEVIQQIRTNVQQILDFNRSWFYPTGPQVAAWNNFNQAALKTFVESSFDALDLFSRKKGLEIYGWQILQQLHVVTKNIIDSYSVHTSIHPTQITTQHFQSLNYLEQLVNLLRSTGIYTELKFDLKAEAESIKDAITLSKRLIAEKPAFESSIKVFHEALKGREDFTNSIINEKGELFLSAAKEHSPVRFVSLWGKCDRFFSLGFCFPVGNVWQLILALFFSGIVLFMVFDFIRLGDIQKEIGIGFAILRVSALIIPSYFAFFFSRQYLLGKKLYQFYKFKGVALSTLSNLYRLYPDQQSLIMERALAVIFSEFKEKIDGDVSQKDLLGFLSHVLSKK